MTFTVNVAKMLTAAGNLDYDAVISGDYNVWVTDIRF